MEAGFLVVGLGNPGKEHVGTRHNVGFMVADRLLDRHGGPGWREKFSGLAARIDIESKPVLLLKPMTYMNLSGRSVARAASYHRVPHERIVVVHDDLDLRFGAVRVKKGGGTGGHKGLVSCVDLLGGGGFLRVRIGIGRPPRGDATDHVLSVFTVEETSVLTDIIARGADAVEKIIGRDPVAAMNEFNRRTQGGEHGQK